MNQASERFFPLLSVAEWKTQLPVLSEKLASLKTLAVHPNEHGIYAATGDQNRDTSSGYQNAWLRDNAMVAFSQWECGDPESAIKTAQGLTTFLLTQTAKLERIIKIPTLKGEVAERPHVRFDAKTLREVSQSWAHAQNDALAYVAWLRIRLAIRARFDLGATERELYGLFPRYFQAIEYWHDRDSGAWEEARKVNSSSVGAVMAALIEFRRYLGTGGHLPGVQPSDLEKLIRMGERTLDRQLPFESPPGRKTDSALLFLIYPLGVIRDQQVQRLILSLVRARLVREHGVCRYVGDSYYCQDYDEWFPPGIRTSDFSDRIGLRDEFLKPGSEAQWCLFDPLLSAFYGTGASSQLTRDDLIRRQLEYFNRAVAQITMDGKCPELYYQKKGAFVTNEHTPLVWTQAFVKLALHQLEVNSGLI